MFIVFKNDPSCLDKHFVSSDVKFPSVKIKSQGGLVSPVSLRV